MGVGLTMGGQQAEHNNGASILARCVILSQARLSHCATSCTEILLYLLLLYYSYYERWDQQALRGRWCGS